MSPHSNDEDHHTGQDRPGNPHDKQRIDPETGTVHRPDPIAGVVEPDAGTPAGQDAGAGAQREVLSGPSRSCRTGSTRSASQMRKPCLPTMRTPTLRTRARAQPLRSSCSMTYPTSAGADRPAGVSSEIGSRWSRQGSSRCCRVWSDRAGAGAGNQGCAAPDPSAPTVPGVVGAVSARFWGGLEGRKLGLSPPPGGTMRSFLGSCPSPGLGPEARPFSLPGPSPRGALSALTAPITAPPARIHGPAMMIGSLQV